jgi:uncharacterized protein DUF4157
VSAALASEVKASKADASALRMNEPGDAYEREADRAAEQVVSGTTRAAAWSLSRVGMAAPLQRKVEMRHDPNPRFSGFARLPELIDRLNRISKALTFSMSANKLVYVQRPGASLGNFDKQMQGFIDQADLIPMRLTNRHGRLGDPEHGFSAQITGDNFASGYVDIDDLLASDDLGLQEFLVHMLRERTETPHYAARLGSSSLELSSSLKEAQFLDAHEKGVDAEVALMNDFFGDNTIQADPTDTTIGPNDRAFINHDNDHIYSRIRQGTGNQSGVQSLHVEVVTADGRTLTPEQYRALRQQKAAGAGATTVHPKAASGSGRPHISGLYIGAPGDALEREADRAADQVMSGATTGTAASLSRVGMTAPLQRECSCGTCDECELKKAAMLQRDAQGGVAPARAPSIVRDVLRGQGHPLDRSTLSFMESRFGHDFGNVRIFNDDASARSAQAVSAHAYTVGDKIVFNHGAYDPSSEKGARLLAHELAHVVQQGSGQIAPTVQRQRCGHDGTPTKCGASNGIWTLIDTATDQATKYSIDDLIVEDGLKNLGGGGEWVRQVQAPPNPVKSDTAVRGRVDGAKVTTAASLDVEIVEIKARSDLGGGCTRASLETNGYVRELQLLAPLIVPMAQKLSAIGGLKVEGGQCKKPKAADKKALQGAGVDFANSSSVNAWCFYNSLQDGLGRTFATAFSAVNIRPNADGSPDKTYRLPYGVGINCRKTKANPTGAGLRILEYQVNQKGGVSYGCKDICGAQDEKEKHKEKTKDVTDAPGDKLSLRDRPPLELDVPADPKRPRLPDPNQVGDPQGESITDTRDTDEQDPVQLPPQGVSEWDVLLVTLGTIATVAVLNQALKALSDPAEKAATRVLIEETIEQGVAKGATALKSLDSKNIARYGTAEGDALVKGADEAAVLAAKASPRLAARLGPKALKGLTRAAPIIAIALTLNEARAAISHVRKGGTIELGPSLDDVDLSGDTHIKATGPQGAKKPSGDAKLTDTVVDIQTKSAPNVSGHVDIDAEKVTIRGEAASEGSPVTVNMRTKLRNTTVTFKNQGIVRDGKILAGNLDVSDSQIEIDLGAGTLDAPRKPGEKVTIAGAKIKVTSVSGGGAGTGGTGSSSASGPQPAPQTTQPQSPSQSPSAPTPAVAQPPIAGPDREALVKEIQRDEDLRRLYTAITGKDGALVTDESLRRFVGLKAIMKRHPAAVDQVIAGLQPGSIVDPIKDVIEPIERVLSRENEKLKQGLQQALSKSVPGTTPGGSGVGSAAQGGNAAGPGQEQPEAPGKAGDDKGGQGAQGSGAGRTDPAAASSATNPSATAVPFSGLQSQLGYPTYPTLDLKSGPPATYTYWVNLDVTVHGVVLTYKLPLSLHTPKMLRPGLREVWRAEYSYEAPSGVFKSAEGDLPIRFTDAGQGQYQTRLVLLKNPLDK